MNPQYLAFGGLAPGLLSTCWKFVFVPRFSQRRFVSGFRPTT
jgi:hypothetical protein